MASRLRMRPLGVALAAVLVGGAAFAQEARRELRWRFDGVDGYMFHAPSSQASHATARQPRRQGAFVVPLYAASVQDGWRNEGAAVGTTDLVDYHAFSLPRQAVGPGDTWTVERVHEDVPTHRPPGEPPSPPSAVRVHGDARCEAAPGGRLALVKTLVFEREGEPDVIGASGVRLRVLFDPAAGIVRRVEGTLTYPSAQTSGLTYELGAPIRFGSAEQRRALDQAIARGVAIMRKSIERGEYQRRGGIHRHALLALKQAGVSERDPVVVASLPALDALDWNAEIGTAELAHTRGISRALRWLLAPTAASPGPEAATAAAGANEGSEPDPDDEPRRTTGARRAGADPGGSAREAAAGDEAGPPIKALDRPARARLAHLTAMLLKAREPEAGGWPSVRDDPRLPAYNDRWEGGDVVSTREAVLALEALQRAGGRVPASLFSSAAMALLAAQQASGRPVALSIDWGAGAPSWLAEAYAEAGGDGPVEARGWSVALAAPPRRAFGREAPGVAVSWETAAAVSALLACHRALDHRGRVSRRLEREIAAGVLGGLAWLQLRWGSARAWPKGWYDRSFTAYWCVLTEALARASIDRVGGHAWRGEAAVEMLCAELGPRPSHSETLRQLYGAENEGGGWGHSGGTVDAVMAMCRARSAWAAASEPDPPAESSEGR